MNASRCQLDLKKTNCCQLELKKTSCHQNATSHMHASCRLELKMQVEVAVVRQLELKMQVGPSKVVQALVQLPPLTTNSLVVV